MDPALEIAEDESRGCVPPPAAERMYFLTDANYNVTGVVRKIDGLWQVAERVRQCALRSGRL